MYFFGLPLLGVRAPNVHRDRSGGQALSWMLGVPGAGSCLLEVTVPYSAAAFDEKLVAGPAVPSYVSREVKHARLFLCTLCCFSDK